RRAWGMHSRRRRGDPPTRRAPIPCRPSRRRSLAHRAGRDRGRSHPPPHTTRTCTRPPSTTRHATAYARTGAGVVPYTRRRVPACHRVPRVRTRTRRAAFPARGRAGSTAAAGASYTGHVTALDVSEGDSTVGAAQMFIDGKWTPAASGKTYEVPNPATEETIGSAPDAGVEDVARAIAAARKAFEEGPWPRSTRHERHRALMRIADALERRKEEMRKLLIEEAAATYIEHGIQVEAPIEQARAYAELALRFEFEEQLPSRATMGPMGPQMNTG